MRSVKARFKYYQKRHPNLSDFVCFGRAVKDQGFSHRTIRENLQFIDPEDFDVDDIADVMEHYNELTSRCF